MERMDDNMKHTIESLTKINQRFLSKHYELYQSDVNMANMYTELIEKSRSNEIPRAGDVVQYTTENGEYYSFAHIEYIKDGEANICEQGNPSIHKRDNEIGFGFSTSGGAWCDIPVNKMKYIGTTEKRFWDFGHCGACGDGGIDFYATVNMWEYNANENKYSTKTHDKYYVFYSKKEVGCGYHFTASKEGMSSNAWRTEKELQAWLRTMRAVVAPGNWNGMVVWTYKEIKHHLSPKEYDALDAIEDIMCMNGTRMCKRIYDDENFTIHTYFVWYWNDPEMGDFYEQSAKQNEIRKRYELDWKCKPNDYARKELESGKVQPIEIMKYFMKDGE